MAACEAGVACITATTAAARASGALLVRCLSDAACAVDPRLRTLIDPCHRRVKLSDLSHPVLWRLRTALEPERVAQRDDQLVTAARSQGRNRRRAAPRPAPRPKPVTGRTPDLLAPTVQRSLEPRVPRAPPPHRRPVNTQLVRHLRVRHPGSDEVNGTQPLCVQLLRGIALRCRRRCGSGHGSSVAGDAVRASRRHSRDITTNTRSRFFESWRSRPPLT